MRTIICKCQCKRIYLRPCPYCGFIGDRERERRTFLQSLLKGMEKFNQKTLVPDSLRKKLDFEKDSEWEKIRKEIQRLEALDQEMVQAGLI